MRVAAKIVDILLEADEVDPKAFVAGRNVEQYEPMLMHGSYGTLKVDPYDGTVMQYSDYPEDDEEEKGQQYADIVKFDLPELRQWILKNGSPEWVARIDDIMAPGNEFDIVDVGFWTDKGEYVAAEEEHRQMSWSNRVP